MHCFPSNLILDTSGSLRERAASEVMVMSTMHGLEPLPARHGRQSLSARFLATARSVSDAAVSCSHSRRQRPPQYSLLPITQRLHHLMHPIPVVRIAAPQHAREVLLPSALK